MNAQQHAARTGGSVIRPSIFRKPAVIAVIVAAVSIATMLVVNHTNLVIDRRAPQTPPGTTFNTVNNVGGSVTPTLPESAIKPTPPGPKPVEPAIPTK